MQKAEVRELIRKYKERLERELKAKPSEIKPIFSREYEVFRRELLPRKLTFYEKACNVAAKILKIKPGKEKEKELLDAIRTCHLKITPEGAVSLPIGATILILLFGVFISIFLFRSSFLLLFFLVFAGLSYYALNKLPFFLATSWRMKASNQMVLCIFYVVTFMRHTPNLERAIKFAAEHIDPPLALDLKKVLWDVETGEYENVKEAMDVYLNGWRKWNPEFVEAFHLVESSLYEASEDRRVGLLDKALDLILTETYEKMLHFAHNLKGPVTMLHMLGIILPILGLVILPLVVNFLGNVKWYHLALLYNVALPIIVYFFGRNILAKRPTGYGDSDISEINPQLKKYRYVLIRIGRKEIKVSPSAIAFFVGAVLLFIGLLPIIIHAVSPEFDADFIAGSKFLDYRESRVEAGVIVGPYGLGASLLSLFVVLALGIGLGIYFRIRSSRLMKIREQTRELEDEFASSLFQLGNRLGDNLPAEIAFSKVAAVSRETPAGRFFKIVAANISRLGMSVKEALFNPYTGAITYFPSRIIESSMKVLLEAIKKGPLIAARAILSVARYIKEIHKVNERLKDLLAEELSSMRSQIKFLAPTIAGIVVGISSMVITILLKLSEQLSAISAAGEASIAQMNLLEMFGDGVPTYFFQMIVGIYVVQVIFILTVLANGIENGADKLAEKYALGRNLIKSTLLYCFVAGLVMLLFNIIATQVIRFAV